MVQAIERVQGLSVGRPAFYCSRNTKSFLRRQEINKVKNSTLTMEQLSGRPQLTFDGIPIRRVDKLAADEARVT